MQMLKLTAYAITAGVFAFLYVDLILTAARVVLGTASTEELLASLMWLGGLGLAAAIVTYEPSGSGGGGAP